MTFPICIIHLPSDINCLHFNRSIFTLVVRCNLKHIEEKLQKLIAHNITLRLDGIDLDKPWKWIYLSDGLLSCVHRGKATSVYFNPDLRGLPFDSHKLNLTFEIPRCETGEGNPTFRFKCQVQEKKFGDGGMLHFKDDFVRTPEFKIIAHKTKIELSENGVSVIFPLFREPAHLILSIIVPLIILNLSALAIYVLGPSETANKLSIIVTLLLASFAFIAVIRQNIPKVPYNTTIDIQIITTLVVLFVNLLEAVITALVGEEYVALIRYISLGIGCILTFGSSLYIGFRWYIFSLQISKEREDEEDVHSHDVKKFYNYRELSLFFPEALRV